MKKISVGICDDGKELCCEIEQFILAYGRKQNLALDCFVWYSGEELCDDLKQGIHIDILFLDIALMEMDGVEVGKYIRNCLDDREMQIVYISGYQAYAQSLFQNQPLDFILKPISEQQIIDAMDLAVNILGKTRRVFSYHKGKELYYMPCNQIIYFTSAGRKIKMITQLGEDEFYGKIDELKNKLPEDFLLIHKSYYINRRWIQRYSYENIELFDKTILPIAKAKRKCIRETMLEEEWNV